MTKKFIYLFLIIFFVVLFSNAKKNVDIELKYDTNEANSCISYNTEGHLVHFFPVEKKLLIKSINIYCRKKDKYSKNAKLYILNNNYKVIYNKDYNPNIFSSKADWVKIPVENNVIVDKEFYVLFITYSSRDDGVYVYYNSNKNENHSDLATLKGNASWIPEQMKKEKTNWKIRAIANFTDNNVKISEELKELYLTTMKDTLKVLNSPEKLSDWMQMNLQYVSKYGQKVGSQTAEDTFNMKTGNCMDLAIFSFYILKDNNFNPMIMTIQLSNNSEKNHAICTFKIKNKFYKIDNGVLSGPYSNYIEISKIHDENWWRYLLFDSIENAVDFKNPVEEVYKK